MFDNVRCLYSLPLPTRDAWGWQSKDTPTQSLDTYEIRADGTLWHLVYDTRCETTEVTARSPFGFVLHRDNPRWVHVADFNGELEIHDYVETSPPMCGEYSVQFWFRDGKVRDCIVHTPKDAIEEECDAAT